MANALFFNNCPKITLNMNKMNKIAILASGSGTNAERIMEHFAGSALAQVVLVASENREAYALERARRRGVEAMAFSMAELGDGGLLAELQRRGVDFVVLAGFLKLVPQAMVEAFPRRMVNIHPALLPKYGGRGMYGHHVHEAVLAHGERRSGITIHYVNGVYDSGDVILRAECPVLPDDTPDTLAERIHSLEHQHYPAVIEHLLRGDCSYNGAVLNI